MNFTHRCPNCARLWLCGSIQTPEMIRCGLVTENCCPRCRGTAPRYCEEAEEEQHVPVETEMPGTAGVGVAVADGGRHTRTERRRLNAERGSSNERSDHGDR
jgi:hypothetical protein